MKARTDRSGSTRVRWVGWLVIALAWLAGFAACELLARRYADFVLVDGRPANVASHDEHGGLTLQTLGGVAVWRRAHPDRPAPRAVKEGFRIVVLGDSILLPALLDDRFGTARLLETELNARLDAGPYEVVNLSEGGWNTIQQEQVLLHEGLPLAPDLVLVGVSPNDAKQFAYRDGQLLEVHFLHDLDRRSEGAVARLAGSWSYLYNLIWLRWKSFEYGADAERRPEEIEAIVEPLQRMHARTAAHGARLALLCLPLLAGDRFDPEADRCAFRHLVAWASKAGVPLLDPIPAYAPYPTQELRIDNIHLSPAGHQVLARRVFDWLVELRLVPYQRPRTR